MSGVIVMGAYLLRSHDVAVLYADKEDTVSVYWRILIGEESLKSNFKAPS